MNDSVKDAQVCTNDHASQKATMSSAHVPQNMDALKAPAGCNPSGFGDKPLSGGRVK
jgi:hypothetical protein